MSSLNTPENFAYLVETVSIMGQQEGFNRTTEEVRELVKKLLKDFELDAVILSIKYDSVISSPIDLIDFKNQEFLSKYYSKIIPVDYSTTENNFERKNNGNVTKQLATSKDIDGEDVKELLDTQDWTVDDYRNMNVQRKDNVIITNNQMRNANRIPWSQKQGSVRRYDRDNKETLRDTRDLEAPIYKCNHTF